MNINRFTQSTLSVWIISAVIFIAGCDLISKSDYEPGLDADIHELEVLFTEQMATNQKPVLTLQLVTKEFFPCYNYQLQTEFKDIHSTDTSLAIEVGEVTIDNICLTAFGPANAWIHFDERDLIRELLLIQQDYTDRFQIEITDEKAEVKLIDGSFSEIKYNTYYRTPEYSMSSRCSMSEGYSEICDLWFTELESAPFVTRLEFPDDGVIPYPSAHEGSTLEYRYYRYGSEENFEQIKSMFSAFVIDHSEETDGGNFLISNWKRQFLSRHIVIND